MSNTAEKPCPNPCEALQGVLTQLNDLDLLKLRAAVLQQLCTETTRAGASLDDLVKRYAALDQDQTCKTARVRPYLSPDLIAWIDQGVEDFKKKVAELRYAWTSARAEYAKALELRAEKEQAKLKARAAYDLVRLELPAFDNQVKQGEGLNRRADTLIQRQSYPEAYAVLGALRAKIDQAKPPADYMTRLNAAASAVDAAESAFRVADLAAVQKKKAMDDALAALVKGEPALLEKLLEAVRQQNAASKAPVAVAIAG